MVIGRVSGNLYKLLKIKKEIIISTPGSCAEKDCKNMAATVCLSQIITLGPKTFGVNRIGEVIILHICDDCLRKENMIW